MIHNVDAKLDQGSSVEWKSAWTEKALIKGNGVIITGKLLEKRGHNVNATGSEKGFPTNFIALVVQLTDDVVKRAFENGKEVAPQVQNERATRKGYLTIEKEKSKRLDICSPAEFAMLVSGGPDPVPKGFLPPNRLQQLYPNTPNVFEFWADRVKFQKIELGIGKEIRLKTFGDSIFVASVTLVGDNNRFLYNFSGEGDQVESSWTSKITTKSSEAEHNNRQGANDDEWD